MKEGARRSASDHDTMRNLFDVETNAYVSMNESMRDRYWHEAMAKYASVNVSNFNTEVSWQVWNCFFY